MTTPTRPSAPLLAALWLAGAAIAAFTILRYIQPHDEGLMLQAGARIASGQWPYRDFWTNYLPGQTLVLAALDKLFGVNLLAWRIERTLVDATIALLVYAYTRRAGASRPLALLAWLGAAGAIAFPTGPGPNPPALMLALAALLLAPPRARVAALAAALATLFRAEIGVAAILGVLILDTRRVQVFAIWLLATAALLAAPFAVAPHAMISDTIGFLSIQHLQRLPLPLDFHGPLRPSKLIEFYAPLILLGACAAWLASALRRPPPRQALACLPLVIVGLGYMLGRTDQFHLVPLNITLALLLAVSATCATRAPRALLVIALVLVAASGIERRVGQALHPPALAAVPGPAAAGVLTTPQDARALRGLRATVDRLTPTNAKIFVANPRHDIVRVGDPLLYVILGRRNATRYDVMQPGIVTTAPVQREIIRSLRGVNLIVRWLNPTASAREPDDHQSGAHLLDRYIAARFHAVARYGYYQVLTRR